MENRHLKFGKSTISMGHAFNGRLLVGTINHHEIAVICSEPPLEVARINRPKFSPRIQLAFSAIGGTKKHT